MRYLNVITVCIVLGTCARTMADNNDPDKSKTKAEKVLKTMNSREKKPVKSKRRLNPFRCPDFGDISKEDWKTNRRGIEALDPDFVLPPFENIKADESGASVWNRRYLIADSGLIEKALISGESFMSRPMSLNLVINGQKANFKLGENRLIENKKGRAVFERKLTSPNLDISTLTTIEYDGMVRVDMTLTPKKEISIDKFSYAFHLPRSNALFMHFIGCPNKNYLSIMIPKQSYTMSVPEANGVFMNEPFKTLVWLGNHDKGFLWFCGSEEHWSPQDQTKRPEALKAEVNGNDVSFTVSPVTAPYKIDSPITYTFGFFATPVRPMPDGWRTWLFTTRQAMYGSEAKHGHVGNMAMIWPDEYRTIGAYPRIRDTQKVKKFIDQLHASGNNALTYCDPIRVGIGYLKYLDSPPKSQQLNDLFLAKSGADADAFVYRVPELVENMKNWQTLPEMIYSYGGHKGARQVRVSSASGWADFFCFLIEKMAMLGFDGFGDIDNCFPIRDMNPAHGAGYVGQDGKRHAEWDWFARRDLMKRIAAVFLKVRNGKPGILVAHASATWSIPFISFCDANMIYEHSNSGYYSNKNFLSKYCKNNSKISDDIKNGGKKYLRWAFPKERWQAELTGHQFGLPAVIMSNLTKSPQINKEYAKSEHAARELGAFVIAHDSILWPIWCNTAPLIKIVKIREQFGLGKKDVSFFPYWSNKNPVKSSNPAISVTTYRRPGKYLLNVCNLTENNAESEIDLSNISPVSIKDAETDAEIKLHNNKFNVILGERDYKIFIVTTTMEKIK